MMARANSFTMGNYTETNNYLIQNYELVNTETHVGEVYIFKNTDMPNGPIPK